jgi:pyridoxamine 5'-phosphate oxidase family protein
VFSVEEVAYLKTQRLARVATVSPKGQPEVSPVAFEFDGAYFWIGSHDQSFFSKNQRYRNITRGNAKVALVIDDLKSIDPWRLRGIKVLGTAEKLEHDGIFGKRSYFRISPRVSVSWGIEKSKDGRQRSRKVH